ncbi:hypothetical protein [Frigidibacter sp. SD6-1]|uniref:hypothetical protein n=1 Tax=Frigidibacter sp. SD6-1 TaxID=3032581 RepID=UPI0024E0247B|nr:hypothetical protein [Frigidibacter sp. SD6-1]
MRPENKPRPLYRKVNSRTHNVRHGHGGDYRHERNTKAEKANESHLGSMHSGHRHGLDYTPLFRFLLSRVGQDWNLTFGEAVSRIDCVEPIFWMVALRAEDRESYFRCGESSYFSKLYVDEQNILQLVDPTLVADSMKPFCSCCTHTLNGERFGLAHSED